MGFAAVPGQDLQSSVTCRFCDRSLALLGPQTRWFLKEERHAGTYFGYR
jgi:hypothetical protein